MRQWMPAVSILIVVSLLSPSLFASSPTITGFNISTAHVVGNEARQVYGSDFAAGVKVFMGGVEAQVTGVIPSIVYIKTPPHAAGVVSVTVQNLDGGTATLADSFTFVSPNPNPTGLSRSSASVLGRDAMQVTGTDFQTGAKVKFGDVEVTPYSVNFNTLYLHTPPHAAGTVDIIVTNPDQKTGILPNAFTFISYAPVPERLNKTTGSVIGNDSLVVSGREFQIGATVKIGTLTAPVYSHTDCCNIGVYTPSQPAGTYDVVVTNPDGKTGTLPNAYTYVSNPPTISSLNDIEGSVLGDEAIQIRGTEFQQGATVRMGSALARVDTVTPTIIYAHTPSHPEGAVDVTVTNPDDKSATKTSAFTFVSYPPVVSSLDVTEGSVVGDQAIQIRGSDFQPGAKVKMGNVFARVDTVTFSVIYAHTPQHAEGVVDVTVINPDNKSATKASAFTFVSYPPSISSLNVTEGSVVGDEAIQIRGNNFLPGAKVKMGEVFARVDTVTFTIIYAHTPKHAEGVVDVTVVNPDNKSATKNAAFEFKSYAPVITTVTPSTTSIFGNQAFKVDGENFLDGAIITIGGAQAKVDAVSFRTIFAHTPDPTPGEGTFPLIVRNPDGKTATTSFTFVSNAPTVESIVPNTGSVIGDMAIQVKGSEFQDGAKLFIGDIEARVDNVTFGIIYAHTRVGRAGTFDVIVKNPDGLMAVLPNAFTYVSSGPKVTEIVPTEGSIVGNNAIQIGGEEFQQGLKVFMGGVEARVDTVTPGRIYAHTPPHAAGTVDVRVVQPDGKSTTIPNGYKFVAYPPTILEVSPRTGSQHGNEGIRIIGDEFRPGARVFFDGVEVRLDNVIHRIIYLHTPAHAPGAVDVEVRNTDGTSVVIDNAYVFLTDVPRLSIASLPRALITTADGSVASGSFSIVNVGSSRATLSAEAIADPVRGAFFTAEATPASIAPGEVASVLVKSLPLSKPGVYRGHVRVTAPGISAPLEVPIALFAIAVAGTRVTDVIAIESRIDLTAPPGINPAGTAQFKNIGSDRVEGILTADQPWIIPQPNIIGIDPQATVAVDFAIDRAKRPDGDDPNGTATGTLFFVYVAGTTSGKSTSNTLAGQTPVTINDTVPPGTLFTGPIPPLAPGEVALFVPGVGHVMGGGKKLFVSDFSVVNTFLLPLADLKIFYLNRGTSASSASGLQTKSLGPSSAVTLADVVGTSFNQTGDTSGMLQLRTRSLERISVNANVFVANDAKGTFGTSIPVFRSDRAVAKGQSMVVTGLRKDAGFRTNFYVQEVSGTASSFTIVLKDATGRELSRQDGSIDPFATSYFGDLAPEGGTTAVVTNSGEGKIVAYATPVDVSTGDTWGITDWRRYYGYEGSAPVVIPILGSARSSGATYFRTDLSVANLSNKEARGRLTYYEETGFTGDKVLALEASETKTFNDVVEQLFGRPGKGYATFTPLEGDFALSSRTFATIGNDPGTFGTAVPILPATAALGLGRSRLYGGLRDSATPEAKKGGTFRINLGLMETTGAPVTVQISLLLANGSRLAAGFQDSKTYTLAPHQFRQISAIVDDVLGRDRRIKDYGDLNNFQLKVDVIEGSGTVVSYLSVTDNGTSDTSLRTE